MPVVPKPAAILALARVSTAATSTMPARPAAAPPRKHMVSTSRPTESPTTLAARRLPPAMRAAKPKTV